MCVKREALCALIPHDGAMCLLDTVERWDDQTIECSTMTHADPGNVLRSRGRLAAACGVEYAGQAMAAHGALLQGETDGSPAIGVLAAIKDLQLRVERLDDRAGLLTVAAERLFGDENGFIYAFSVRDGGEELVSGRATVFTTRGDGV